MSLLQAGRQAGWQGTGTQASASDRQAGRLAGRAHRHLPQAGVACPVLAVVGLSRSSPTTCLGYGLNP